MRKSPVPASRMLLMALGFVIWSAAFIVLYGTNAIGCAFGWPEGVQRAVIVGLALVFFAILAGLTVWSWRHFRRAKTEEPDPGPSLAQLGIYGSGAAFVAAIGVFVPGFVTSMCI